MAKSRKQQGTQASEENFNFSNSSEDARGKTDREDDIALDSSHEGENELDREKKDLPLARPKGMDA